MDFSKVKTIYMIGIKGVGMTMLAEFLAHQGYEVSGSDTDEIFMTDQVLARAGISVHQGFSAEHITSESDLVIYSTAYTEVTNEEVAAAKQKNRKLATYAEAMGTVFNTHHGIAVCGSHGKTTTTAWLGYVLKQSGLDPNVMVGARVPQFGGAGTVGSSNYLVIEADEYQNKLKHFNPKMILLNNIEWDHPDFFPTTADYENVFGDFIAKLPKSGTLIANMDDEVVRRLAETRSIGKVIGYGLNSPADYTATDITHHNGRQHFKVRVGSDNAAQLEANETDELGNFSIQLNGLHNISNALAVIAAGIELGVELRLIREHLDGFTGTARRMEIMGEYNGATIIDDYGHHPTEIQATLEAVRQKYGDRKLRVVFHPHTFTRTKALLEDFGRSFSKADEVIILGIYGSAREEHGGVTEEDVAAELKKNGQAHVFTKATLEEAEAYLRETAQDGDVILLLGAGDVFRIGERLLNVIPA